MADNDVTQTEMAKRLKTSRPALQRLLDPENYSVTLLALNRVAAILGKKINIYLVNPTNATLEKSNKKK
jgi:antitoxin HicB